MADSQLSPQSGCELPSQTVLTSHLGTNYNHKRSTLRNEYISRVRVIPSLNPRGEILRQTDRQTQTDH